jgi:hypothetical protein
VNCMELLALNCQHCSAPLKVPADAKFVTCTHCGSQLAVRRGGSVAWTETLDAIDDRTERMAEQLDDLHRRSAVADLDRRWEAERERFYVSGKHGERHLPMPGASIICGVMITVFGTIWTAIACAMGGFMAGNAPGPFDVIGMLFPLFGVAFGAFGIAISVWSYRKAGEYEQAEAAYRRERERLLGKDGAKSETAAGGRG